MKQSFNRYLIDSMHLTKKDLAFDAYQKGLMFAPSVIVVCCPERGFPAFKTYINKSVALNKVLISNLRKGRVSKIFPVESETLLSLIDL